MTALFIFIVTGLLITLAIQQGVDEYRFEKAAETPEHKRLVSGRFIIYVVMSMYGLFLILKLMGLL